MFRFAKLMNMTNLRSRANNFFEAILIKTLVNFNYSFGIKNFRIKEIGIPKFKSNQKNKTSSASLTAQVKWNQRRIL